VLTTTEQTLSHKERVARALRGEPGDRLCKGDILIHPRLARQLVASDTTEAENSKEYGSDGILPVEVPRREEIELDIRARSVLGHDLAVFWNDGVYKITSRDEAGVRVRNHWGMRLVIDEQEEHYLGPAEEIHNPEDILMRELPAIDSYDTTGIRMYQEQSDLFVFGLVNGLFQCAYMTIGFEKYMLWSIEQPEVLEAFTEKLLQLNIAVARHFIDAGADGILVGDDLCYNAGPYLSRETLRRLIFSRYRRMVAAIKQYREVPIVLHCDGNINTVLDDIVACDFDGLQALQSSAGVDIGEVRQRVGRRICLWGNVDIEQCLAHGDEASIRETVRRTIDAAAEGGGYIFSSTNMLSDAVPPGNALIMYDEATKYYEAKYQGNLRDANG